jgi:hypothetical protein
MSGKDQTTMTGLEQHNAEVRAKWDTTHQAAHVAVLEAIP